MSALLILGGLLLCLPGWIWLWLRTAREHWFWALVGAFPPLALLSGLLNWRAAWLPLLVFLAGLGTLGGGLWQLWQTQPEQMERLLRGQWAEYPAANSDLLQGRLQNQAFTPGRIRFLHGTLSLAQDTDFLAGKEVRLDLSAFGTALLGERFVLDILPTDRGELPVITLLWQDRASGLLQTRHISHGYTLQLEFERQPEGLQGRLYLSLPAQLATLVSGSFHVAAVDEQQDPLWNQSVEEQGNSEQQEPVATQTQEKTDSFSLEQLLAEPSAYLHQTLRIETATGRQVRGDFQGINDDGELLIRQMIKAPGFVVFQVIPAEISQIRLEN